MVQLGTQNIPETYTVDVSNCFKTLLQSDIQTRTIDEMWKDTQQSMLDEMWTDTQQSMLDLERSNIPCK